MSTSDTPPAKRLKLTKQDLEELSKEEIIERWLEQEQYLDLLEMRHTEGQKESMELMNLRESEDKLRQQQLEATRRENLLVMRLAAKEQEMQEYANQIQELKQAQTPGSAQLRSTLLDPAVNLMFERMKKELNATKAKLEETQNELSAWKFTPDSNTGKRLMAKCRLLYQENEELGKMISSGRMAKLEGDLALQKNFSEEMKKSQAELDEFLLELDEDVEGMQSTILYLQQQLRESKEQVLRLQSENQHLQTMNLNTSTTLYDLPKPNASVSNLECFTEQSVRQRETLEDRPTDKMELSNCFGNHSTAENRCNSYSKSFTEEETDAITNKLGDPSPVVGNNELSNNVTASDTSEQIQTQGGESIIAEAQTISTDWLTLDKNDSLDSQDHCELMLTNGKSANGSPIRNT